MCRLNLHLPINVSQYIKRRTSVPYKATFQYAFQVQQLAQRPAICLIQCHNVFSSQYPILLYGRVWFINRNNVMLYLLILQTHRFHGYYSRLVMHTSDYCSQKAIYYSDWQRTDIDPTRLAIWVGFSLSDI